MSSNKIKLNHRGISELAKSAEMRRAVKAVADEMARNIEAQHITVGDRDGDPHEIPLPVKVEEQVTDRARAVVVLAHPAGLAVQAKHGALTRAAAEAGLEVRGE